LAFASGIWFIIAKAGCVMALGRTVNVVYDYAAGKSAPVPLGWRTQIEPFERRV
jgi:acyl-CoA thioesterase FadM